MKRFILCVCSGLLLFTSCSKDGKTMVEIPDANFKAYLLENFDKNKDGNISVKEAKAVKEINCSGRNIESIVGLGNFVNLKSLDCSNNKLSIVELEKNNKISKLDCRRNNSGLYIYVAPSTSLKTASAKAPSINDLQGSIQMAPNMIDKSKCLCDNETVIVFSFHD